MTNTLTLWSLLTLFIGIFLGIVIISVFNGYTWFIIIPAALTFLGWAYVVLAFHKKLEIKAKK